MPPNPTPLPHAGTVDIGALAASIKIDVLEAAAEALVLAIQSCDDDGRDGVRLNEIQRIKLIESQLDSFGGIEQTIRAELDSTIPEQFHWRPTRS